MRKTQRYNLKRIIPTVLLAMSTIPFFTSCDKDPIDPIKTKFNTTADFKIGEDYTNIQGSALNQYLTNSKGEAPDTLFLNNTGVQELNSANGNTGIDVLRATRSKALSLGIFVKGIGNEIVIAELSDAELDFLKNDLQFRIKDNRLTDEQKRILELIELEKQQRAAGRAAVAPARNGIEVFFDSNFEKAEQKELGRKAQNWPDSARVFAKEHEAAMRVELGGYTGDFPVNNPELRTLFDGSKTYVLTIEELALLQNQGNGK